MTPTWVKRNNYYLMEWTRLADVVAGWPAEDGWVALESFTTKRDVGEYPKMCELWDGRPENWPETFDVIAW
jgi:hypothetical protein